jgi:hypothetical protein
MVSVPRWFHLRQPQPSRPPAALLCWAAVVALAPLDTPAAIPGAIQNPPPAPAPAAAPEPTAALLPEASPEQLEAQLRQAEEIFRRPAEQEQSIPLFSVLIDLLEERRQTRGGLEEDERSLLTRSLVYRAEAVFNLGRAEEADEDLVHLLRVDPEMQLPPGQFSRKLVERHEALRRKMVGYVELVLDPVDAEVTLDGEPIDALTPRLAVLTGAHRVVARRPGFADAETDLEVTAGKVAPVTLLLERQSAVLRLVTRPPGAKVEVDGQPAGVTAAPPQAASDPELSQALWIDGLEPGGHTLRLEKEGYRTQIVEVNLPGFVDYESTVELELEEGVVRLRLLSAGSRVVVDGETRPAEPAGEGAARVRLAPGPHLLEIFHPELGAFERRFDLADRETLEVTVELQPALTLVGILGGDDIARTELRQSLGTALTPLEGWTFLDRLEEGSVILQENRADAGGFRRAAERQALPEAWNVLQEALADAVFGTVYMLGVLSDDLVASHADLWIWYRSADTTRPDRVTVPLRNAAAMDELVTRLETPVQLERAWLGALLIDSQAAPGPVVAEVAPEGPAGRAGLRAGDVIQSLDGRTAASTADVLDRLAAASPGTEITLQVLRSGETPTLRIRLGSSPSVVPLEDPGRLYAMVSARLATPGGEAPEWLVALNHAAVALHFRAWEEAMRWLRPVHGPDGPGLGQAAVSYWLGLALEAVGPTYLDQARTALERAAAIEDARLFDNDGPRIYPRARARLDGLVAPAGN